MLYSHTSNPNMGIHLHARKHLGKGLYYQRLICKGLQVGDLWDSGTHPGCTLVCTKIISVNDSHGVFTNPEDAIGALVEAEFQDNSYQGLPYLPIYNI